jgi:hypothetical protein
MLLCMGKLPPIYGAESTNQRNTDTPSHVYDPTMDPLHIPVPHSCNCDVVPNERANAASTLIASRYPIIINDIGLFERIFFIATALVRISSHTHRQTRIYAHYTLSNSQMCISVIETKRSPIHGLVPLHSGYDDIPPGLPAKHIPPNLLGGCWPPFAQYLSQEAPMELGDWGKFRG